MMSKRDWVGILVWFSVWMLGSYLATMFVTTPVYLVLAGGLCWALAEGIEKIALYLMDRRKK